MDTREILEKVQSGQMSVEEAEAQLKRAPFEDLGYAKIDTQRGIRTGFPEVIYCQGKADDHLLEIFGKLYEEEGQVLGTRATKEQYEMLKEVYPEVQYDEISRIVKIEPQESGSGASDGETGEAGRKDAGKIVVLSAGTADMPVSEEAAQVAEYFGARVERVYDVGVSGLHRLLSQLDVIQDANCIIAVAGMEGALASVVGGLVDVPVIAVPTSVGYGANMNGLSALLTMINSCANGVAVVNIDNGFGAGYIAAQINRLGVRNS